MHPRHTIQRCVLVVLAAVSIPAAAQADFLQQTKLAATDALPPAEQGDSVSVSADGNTALVGASEDNDWTGAAWVYTRDDGVWVQQAKLLGSNATASASQGGSVALSADGNTAIVAGADYLNSSGVAWVYTRAGGVWTQQAELTSGYESAAPGAYVSLSGDGETAVLGVPQDNGYTGAALVFVRSAGTWTEQAKLVAADAAGAAAQGGSVALSADGNTLIVGGNTDNHFAGAAWVYTRSQGIWAEQAKLVGSGASGAAEQGVSVSLSGDGDTAIIGGFGDDGSTGAAWVFTRSPAGRWKQQGAKLVGAGSGIAYQGWSVSLSGDGNKALIGGFRDDGYTGAVWVFRRLHHGWIQQGAKLVGTGALGIPFQGFAVALSADGSTAISGAPQDGLGGAADGTGAVWVYTESSFAGVPGTADCKGRSIRTLAVQYGSLRAAAEALGFTNVEALRAAIQDYCAA